ncbi:extracellular mutant protein 11-domain-containing protein [Aspergillus falconensis]
MAFVPSASAFSLPLPLWQQHPSLRVSRYERKRKNEYNTDEDNDHNGGEDGETTDGLSDFGLTTRSVILSPEEAHQYRVAGLPLNEELPDTKHFPHAPIQERNRKVNNRGSILKELAELEPPIYAPQSAAHQGNLRLHHLAVLTSVLHRCLLEGDYIRAGRAWGLIVREHFSGNSVDVRTDDRWGIGAEILLRKDRQVSDELPEGERTDSGRYGDLPRLLFTRKGFEDAKQYYETLIIQHPYQKTAPNAISALHFYPAMFGLWIYVTQEESAYARRALEERDPASLREPWDDEGAGSENDCQDDWWERYQNLAAGIRAKELAEAERIAARMDGILISPPYSDSPELLELRGMVSQWIADLLISSLPSVKSDDDEDDNGHDMSAIDGDDDISMTTARADGVEARRARRVAMEKRQAELSRSQEFMERAQKRKRGENRQHQPRVMEPSIQTRQALAEQALVEVPPTTLVAPVPIPGNRQAPIDRYGTPFRDQAPAEKPVHRDAFDTDVEGIDESTIAATSVMGNDEVPYRLSPAAQVNPNVNANANMIATVQHMDFRQHSPQPQPQPSPSPTRQLRAGRRTNESKWYEGLGDRALESAGFDLDDLEAASQNTSTAGDDERSNDMDDQRFVSRYRAAEEPLSRRLQNFWTASRRTTYQPDTIGPTEPTKTQSLIPVASTARSLPANSRKVTLTRSMTATPRTRFSPPKPSLLDQLDLTPTRRSPGITRTHSRKERDRNREKEASRTADDTVRASDEGLGLFTDTNHTRAGADDSLRSLNAFDMTNFDDLENDSSMNDPFSRRASIRWVGPPEPDTSPTDTYTDANANTATRTPLTKRHLEPDYPPEIICTKTFSELQAEPFDCTPNPKASRPAAETQPQPPEKGKGEDKISFLLRLSEQERGEYFSKLSMDEWEGCGDLLVEEFSKLMTKMKDLRHARRKTAAIFEVEIKRRHDMVEEQSAEISAKFEEMRAGGAEVLRGRSP